MNWGWKEIIVEVEQVRSLWVQGLPKPSALSHKGSRPATHRPSGLESYNSAPMSCLLESGESDWRSCPADSGGIPACATQLWGQLG